jgi:predicted O-methyltransferase YrrM
MMRTKMSAQVTAKFSGDASTPPTEGARLASADAMEAWNAGKSATQGYYIPYRYASELVPVGAPAWLLAALDAALPTMAHWLEHARANAPRLKAFEHDNADGQSPRYDQDWFTGLDATLAYTMVRVVKPEQIIEIGSGHSTRFMARAISDGELDTRLISIDPAPRRAIDTLCHHVERRPLDGVALNLVSQLEHGDVLFLDGSHVLMPGTDVDLLGTHILPALASGTLVHVHDLFLPDDYPREWRWRNYNEQSLICALVGAGRLSVEFACHWVRSYQPTMLTDVFAPCTTGASETSVWLRVV